MEKQKITGSEALLQSLIAEGVDTIFGYPGGQAIPIYDSLYEYWCVMNKGRRMLHKGMPVYPVK